MCYIKTRKNWHWNFIENNIDNWIQNYMINWIIIVTKFTDVLKKFFKKMMLSNIVENASFDKEKKQVFDSSSFTIAIFVRTSSWIRKYLPTELRTARGAPSRYAHVQLRGRPEHAQAVNLPVSSPEHPRDCSETRFQSMLSSFEKCARSLKSVLDWPYQTLHTHTHITHTHMACASPPRENRLNRLILLFN